MELDILQLRCVCAGWHAATTPRLKIV